MRKKIWNMLCCGILVCSMTACGASESGSSETETAETATQEIAAEETGENSISFADTAFSETSWSGSVTSVDGRVITLSVALMDGSPMDFGSMGGNMGGNDAPGGDGGEAPDKPDGEQPGTGDGEEPGGDGGEAPDKPDGEEPGAGDGEEPVGDGGEAPDLPDGEQPGDDGGNGGEAPDLPDGEAPGEAEMETTTVQLTIADESILFAADGESIALSDIKEGDYLTVETDSEGNLISVTRLDMTEAMPGGAGMSQGSSGGVDSYAAATEFTEDAEVSGEIYASTGTDENAVHVYEGAVVTLNDVTVTRESGDSTGGDNASFYGVGAALLVSDGTACMNGGTVTTDAAGGAGIFSYGDGIVYASDVVITTQQDTSGGIHVAGGGTLYAWDLDVETSGESSAAIRSDRGSGTMVVDGGTYVSNGVGSPAVYCTAEITVNDAVLTATGSEAVCIEGLNSLALFDCDLTGSMQESSQNDCTWNVIVYQSMSGDSEVGNGTFRMSGGSITANNGGMFYTTNTECTFYLSNVDITYASQNDFFLRCTGNANERGWGQSGSNGSQCSFTADAQDMEGDIIYDSISTLDFYMKNGSSLTGAFLDDETCAGNGGDGYCNVYISEDSVWTVTGDSVITALYNEGTIVDESGNTVTITGTDGTVYVQGSSAWTITVESYADSADMSASADGDTFADYAVEQP